MKYVYYFLCVVLLHSCTKNVPVPITPAQDGDTTARLKVEIIPDTIGIVVTDSLVELVDRVVVRLKITSNKPYPLVVTGAAFRTTSFLFTKIRIDASTPITIVSGNPDIVFSGLAIVVPPGTTGTIMKVFLSIGPLARSRTVRRGVLSMNLESLSYLSGSVQYGSAKTVYLKLPDVTVQAPT